MLIGGFKSGEDTGAFVSFGRTTNTGTSDGLRVPSSSNEENHHAPGVSARLLKMPVRDGVERIGAFYCNAYKSSQPPVTEKINTIIMSSRSMIKHNIYINEYSYYD